MKLYISFILLFCQVLFLASCSNDSPQPIPGDKDYIDNFIGSTNHFQFGPEVKGFTYPKFTLKLKAPDSSIIARNGSHSRVNGISDFKLEIGLADGEYQMLYLEYATAENPEISFLADDFPVAQYGLGAKVNVSNGKITVLTSYDEDIELFGDGSKANPYIIESYTHLISLADYINDEDLNKKITTDTYFKQTTEIDMYMASVMADSRYGWLPIGASTILPFRGHYEGAGITHLYINRPNTAGVGLFGIVHNADISGIEMNGLRNYRQFCCRRYCRRINHVWAR